ncbi:MAG: hypothetical protein ACLUTA_15055 [Blautia wexlerae]
MEEQKRETQAGGILRQRILWKIHQKRSEGCTACRQILSLDAGAEFIFCIQGAGKR